MKNTVVIAALVGGVAASPVGDWKSKWHFSHKPPGWSTPSVYTPANPPYPTLSKYPGGHSSPAPTGYSTSQSSSYPNPTGYPTTSPPPYSSQSSTATPASSDACATVSSLASSFLAASPSATPTVPAQIAHDCITSVPFNQSAALALLDTITPYVDWQTTIEYLKEPPEEYAEKVQPAYDFYGFYAGIVEKATDGGYENEYAFGMDLYYAFQMAHDGHFVFYPDSVTGIFSWGRQTPLVSISDDGSSVPKIYVYADVLTASFGNATFTPSPVTGIDGEDSIEFLLNWSQVGSLQDRDALWNNLFYTPAQVALGSSGTGTGTFSGGGRGNKVYPGAVNTLTFANGTTIEKENFARVLQPFDNITNGADIYREYFAVPGGEPQGVQQVAASESSSMMPTSTSNVTMSSSAAVSATPTSVPAPAYPSPFIRQASNQNSGYFLNGDGYDDVAVLAVNSFVGALGFQNVNTYLIDQAVARNKSKLIIDVSANGGGTILQGYDLFKQLFPQILPYGATRFRAHEAFDLIGQEVSAYAGMFERGLYMNETDYAYLSSAFNYRTDADINYEPFDSWEEKYGPFAYGPESDNFTSIIRWNLSDVLIPDNSGGIYVSGYLNRSNITTAPFAPENIVVVYDGYCASTCTIFSELMRQQAGIQTIALGGRPNTDIIQAVGGVKGTNDFGWDSIFVQAEYPFILQQLHDADYYNDTALGAYTDLPLLRGTAYAMNVRDGIREGDETGLPLQFVYEPADCRIFYTAEMVVDETAVWKTVADSAFNGVDHCVAGGLNGTSGATGYKRNVVKKHKARRDVDLSEHWTAMKEVWTGRGGGGISGDSKMIL